MDPVTVIFSAYLNTLQSATYDHVNESFGTQMQAVVVNYEGVKIPYQYQMWTVRQASVCQPYVASVAEYSRCSLAAAGLFNDLCNRLSAQPNGDWRQKKFRNMYCNAAVSYKPTIAKISSAQAAPAANQARQRCNAATVAAMGSQDPELIHQRDQLCAAYRAQRAGE